MRTAPPLAFAALLALAACDEAQQAAAPPPPVELTAEAVDHFCQMDVLEHPGPKAQIHLEGHPQPLWFSQVRDAVAFLRSPEKMGVVTATYVNDMGRAPSWEIPGEGNWIGMDAAHFVIGARIAGGMGAPEFAPFADAAAASAFAAEHGGAVLRLDAIPAEAALAPVDRPTDEGTEG